MGLCSHATFCAVSLKPVHHGTPTELCVHTELAHPCDLQEVLEKALEREMVLSAASRCMDITSPAVGAVEQSPQISRLAVPSTTQPVAQGHQFWTGDQMEHLAKASPLGVKSAGNLPGSQ